MCAQPYRVIDRRAWSIRNGGLAWGTTGPRGSEATVAALSKGVLAPTGEEEVEEGEAEERNSVSPPASRNKEAAR